MNISVGSIKGSLFVYNFNLETKIFTEKFSVQDHIGPISALAADKQGYVTTAGEDESIKVYKSTTCKEVGSAFAVKGKAGGVLLSEKYVLVGGEDGHVNILGKRDMKVYHTIKVTSFNIRHLKNLLRVWIFIILRNFLFVFLKLIDFQFGILQLAV